MKGSSSNVRLKDMRMSGTGRRRDLLFVSALVLFMGILTGCGSGCRLQLFDAGSGRTAAGTSVKDGTVRILSYNVQNVFDGEHDGDEYEQFDPSSSSWNNTKYHQRLAGLRDTLEALDGGVPDIVILLEIEGYDILEDFTAGYMKNSGFAYSAATEEPNSAIEVGVLSRFPIQDILFHRGEYRGSETPRPIMEVQFLIGEERIHLFASHWKSKLGGAEETEGFRMAAAEVIQNRAETVLNNFSDALIIAAGDFNENPDEFERTGKEYRTALMPAELRTADSSSGSIYVTGNPLKADALGRVYYSPWLDGGKAGTEGSYVYRGEWEQIDHFLLSEHFFDDEGLEFSGFTVAADGLTDEETGFPLRWNSFSGRGTSDHLPILLELDVRGMQGR